MPREQQWGGRRVVNPPPRRHIQRSCNMCSSTNIFNKLCPGSVQQVVLKIMSQIKENWINNWDFLKFVIYATMWQFLLLLPRRYKTKKRHWRRPSSTMAYFKRQFSTPEHSVNTNLAFINTYSLCVVTHRVSSNFCATLYKSDECQSLNGYANAQHSV